MLLHIADALALQQIAHLVPQENLANLWPRLTAAVEDGSLGFPREVVSDLAVIARDEQVHSWAAGLGRELDSYTANIKYARTLMTYVLDLGYELGFETLDGRDMCAPHVGRLACQLRDHNHNFCVVTGDTGDSPLGPTLMEICTRAGWTVLDAQKGLSSLGLGDLLNME